MPSGKWLTPALDKAPHKLGLYVHWPFCLSKCPYCDFNSHVRDGVDHDRWADALETDLRTQAAKVDGRPLTAIFFGGGTPSLMAPETVGRVIDTAQQLFGFVNDIEITLEANPTSVEQSRFEGYAAAGVNRLSLGVQALDDEALKFLGRQHSVTEAMTALDVAQRLFSRVSFDLIYARAGQTAQDWQAELERALRLGTDHLSLYQLTIEPETEFGKRHAMGQLPLMQDDLAADLFEMTRELTAAAHMPAYETSNHAKAGQESRHNLIYWNGDDYLGIGPGAHGRVMLGGKRIATVAARTPERWLEAVEANTHGLVDRTALNAREWAEERLMMGLRLTQGLNPAAITALDPALLDRAAINDLAEAGFLTSTADQLAVTDKGAPLLNAILGRIITV